MDDQLSSAEVLDVIASMPASSAFEVAREMAVPTTVVMATVTMTSLLALMAAKNLFMVIPFVVVSLLTVFFLRLHKLLNVESRGSPSQIHRRSLGRCT